MTTPERDLRAFDRFADGASRFVSRPGFFVLCLLLVLVWAPSLPLFDSADTWQLLINTATTIVTFLLVALLQNSQWRDAEATNRKLNATADGLADAMESLAEVMDTLHAEGHRQHLLDQADELRQTVGLERTLSSSDDGHGAGSADGARANGASRHRSGERTGSPEA